jgi:hypothetical protein
MRKIISFTTLCLFLVIGIQSCSAKKQEKNELDSVIFENKDFRNNIDLYLKYLSEFYYNKEHEYIYVRAETSKTKTSFIIYLCGGSYYFFRDSSKIIDYIDYKNYNMLLVGDFPNIVVNIKKNLRLDITKGILLKYFKKDYEKFKLTKYGPAPEIYDYMNMSLEFNEKGHIILLKCEYY